MTFPYKHVLLVGATSGIGRAMADRLIQAGVKVTAVGRRKQRLNEFIAKHGEEKASAMSYDVSDIDGAPQFAADASAQHPDIDCVFLNPGIQRKYKLTDPKDGDLRIPLILAVQVDPNKLYIVSTTSLLALVPAPRIPAYSAAKAALNAFVYCLRDQLRESNVRVIDLAPPLVSTELHDYMGLEKGRGMGMPVEQYAEDAYRALEMGSDEMLGGSVGPTEVFQDLADTRRKIFDEFAPMLRYVD
ncbi:Glucose/ribitol dehydrogenase [Penicillium digitatum]|uniref:Glucose/ribitol dehydrogenase n=1 Tax=Penicillium digitatum TaxID=36651 RepID=A0A7T7BK95_PENDI|nr:Glucose/ribitol dehydrogenase [Penicillium digitatum]